MKRWIVLWGLFMAFIWTGNDSEARKSPVRHAVKGHIRHNANGTTSYVRPHMRGSGSSSTQSSGSAPARNASPPGFFYHAPSLFPTPVPGPSQINTQVKEEEPPPALPESFNAECVEVIEGDLIKVKPIGSETLRTVQLWGVDCPKIGQPTGERARQYTGSLCLRQILVIYPLDTANSKDAEPLPAWVATGQAGLTAVNEELIRNGLAWWDHRTAPRAEGLAALHTQAQRGRVGLWYYPKPVPPWESVQSKP